MNWYIVKNENQLDSPSLLIYKENLVSNLDTMVEAASDVDLLIPHVKTNKMEEVILLMKERGINKVKTATIAEAELAAISGMDFVLLAHQPVGPKINRFINLCKTYRTTEFAVIVDDRKIVEKLSDEASANDMVISVFLDVNNGMNRSGLPIDEQTLNFYQSLFRAPSIVCKGLHVYDGQWRQADVEERRDSILTSFTAVEDLISDIEYSGLPRPIVIAGGSPAFSVHKQFSDRLVSPGTTVFWDWGYAEKCKEQTYKFAALVFTRVISKPSKGIVTVDLGHKAVAAENPIHNRVRFLNLENYTLKSQSEEHGVLEVSNWDEIQVGDCFYGIPYHVCPTVNLYDNAFIIENQEWKETWAVKARNRCLSI
jgi:D-serine deaminase-like pyridoxal phosphate-dependent protein